MTVKDARDRVRTIDGLRDDPESAHSEEDSLWCDVLHAIADGHPQARDLARVAPETEKLEFPRWRA
jgi:hypothetical protein